MRIVRAIAGALLLLIAVPMLIAGAGLWEAAQHRAPGGAFQATTEPIATAGTAVVIWDLDALLRREAPFARGGNTTLRIDAPGRFVGLGPRSAVEHYLGTARLLAVDRVRLARGPLPVDSRVVEPAEAAQTPAEGAVTLGPPAGQPFWRLHSTPERFRPLTFPPSALRERQLALVVMNPDAAPGIASTVTVSVTPRWLDQTTWGVLILGTVFLVLGTAALAWPRPRREVVYVVEPARLPEITAWLGLPLPAGPAPAGPPPTQPSPSAQIRLEWPPAAPEPRTPAPVPASD